MSIVITGTGSYLPHRTIDNDELEATTSDFDRERAGCTLDEWVGERIGVRSRHRAAPGEGTGAMALAAARHALDDAGVDAADLDLIVMSTFTSDHRFPQSVSFVQRELGTRAKCIQLDAACAGFIDATAVAAAMMPTMGLTTALVVHADAVSAVCDPDLFLMQAIFADGSGAVILRDDPSSSGGLLDLRTWSDGTNAHWLSAGGGILSPIDLEGERPADHYLTIDYQSIFGFAIDRMAESLAVVTANAGRHLDDLDWVIAHQTGVKITDAVAERIGLPPERFLMTLEHTGNTSGATIPIALDHFNRLGLLDSGQLIAFPTVGAGMAWGAALCSWVETSAGRQARLSRQDHELLVVG